MTGSDYFWMGLYPLVLLILWPTALILGWSLTIPLVVSIPAILAIAWVVIYIFVMAWVGL